MSGFVAGLNQTIRQFQPSFRHSGSTSAREGAGVPARIMVPRTMFLVCATGLTLFGLLMIYSSSSIVGLTSKQYEYDSAYFLIRQLRYVGMGLAFGGGFALVDYHAWKDLALKVAWALTFLFLILVYTPIAGHDAYGATRWINILGVTVQPSEFAKITVILTGARIAEEYWELGGLDGKEALRLFGIGVAIPLGLILFQPDKGTTGVLVLTLLVMAYLAGVPGKVIGVTFLAAVGLAAIIALRDDYSRARIMTVFDPFLDEFGAGYQLVQGFYALGSGGLTGVGLGLSRQKYNYLPMAYNDFIFAVIGEELGLLGTLAVLAVFALLLWTGLKIAENASDLRGKLIATGCTSLIIIQLLLNVSGVIGIFPLSGKPVPFISYGGSSIVSTLMLVGLVLSVSLRSELPQTQYDKRRSEMRIADAPVPYGGTIEGSTAGRPVPRPRGSLVLPSARDTIAPVGRRHSTRTGLRIVEGDGSQSSEAPSRGTVYDRGQRSIDLGPNPSERLRRRKSQR